MTPRSVREPLSRERVLSAAMAVADGEGIGAVTMRRVAADLGVEAMSLYHHVRGKEALLDGLIEALIGEIQHAVADRERADQTGVRRSGNAASRPARSW